MNSRNFAGLGGGRALAVVLVSVLALLLVNCEKAPKSLTFTIRFKKSKGLDVGQYVKYRDINIGEVLEVYLDEVKRPVHVKVELYPSHTSRVYQETTFRIIKPIFDEPYVMMKNIYTGRTPMQQGEVVYGIENKAGELWAIADAKVRGMFNKFSEWEDDIRGWAVEIQNSPEGKKLIQDTYDFIDKSHKLTKEKYAEFKTETLPSLIEQAKEFKKQLMNERKQDQAKELEKHIEQMQKELNKK